MFKVITSKSIRKDKYSHKLYWDEMDTKCDLGLPSSDFSIFRLSVDISTFLKWSLSVIYSKHIIAYNETNDPEA